MRPRRVIAIAIAVLFGISVPAKGQAPPTGVVRYYHTDAIGSIRAVTDAQGNVVARHDYNAFGEELDTAADSSALRFTAKARDTESGFDYFGARYCASHNGRFTTADPVTPVGVALRDPQIWNRYAYVRDNPLRYIDPDGRCIEDLCIGEIALAIGISKAAVATFAAASAATIVVWNEREAIAHSIISLGAATGSAARELVQMATADEAFARERAKLDNLKGHLKPSDIEGAQRDLAGNPVIRPDGRPYQHLKEVQDAQTGLRKLIEQLKARIQSGKLSKDQVGEAERLLGAASRILDETERIVPR